MRGLGRRRNPLGGDVEVIDGSGGVAREVLHRAPREPGRNGALDSASDARRVVREAVLQVSGNGKVGRLDERLRVRERLVSG